MSGCSFLFLSFVPKCLLSSLKSLYGLPLLSVPHSFFLSLSLLQIFVLYCINSSFVPSFLGSLVFSSPLSLRYLPSLLHFLSLHLIFFLADSASHPLLRLHELYCNHLQMNQFHTVLLYRAFYLIGLKMYYTKIINTYSIMTWNTFETEKHPVV